MRLAKNEKKERLSTKTTSATDTKGRGPQVSGQEDRDADEHNNAIKQDTVNPSNSSPQRTRGLYSFCK